MTKEHLVQLAADLEEIAAKIRLGRYRPGSVTIIDPALQADLNAAFVKLGEIGYKVVRRPDYLMDY